MMVCQHILSLMSHTYLMIAYDTDDKLTPESKIWMLWALIVQLIFKICKFLIEADFTISFNQILGTNKDYA